MPSVFESAFRKSAVPVLDSVFGVLVTLVSGSNSTNPFTARRAGAEYDSPGADFGLQITVRMRDYLLPAASLVIGANTVEPRHRDRIIEGTETLEIVPVGELPAVEYQPATNEFLVHTQLVN